MSLQSSKIDEIDEICETSSHMASYRSTPTPSIPNSNTQHTKHFTLDTQPSAPAADRAGNAALKSFRVIPCHRRKTLRIAMFRHKYISFSFLHIITVPLPCNWSSVRASSPAQRNYLVLHIVILSWP